MMPTPGVSNASPPFASLSALRTAHASLIEQRRMNGDTQELLGAAALFIAQGSATGAIIDIDTERWATQGLLDYWANVLDRAGVESPDPILVEFDPSLAPTLPENPRPYVGLEAFRDIQHDRFFGRKRLINELIKQVATARLVAIVGPSGSGKSSVVQSGLLPALQAGAIGGSERWRYVPPLVPGSEPLVNLARSIQPSNTSLEWVRTQANALRRDPYYLNQLFSQASDQPTVIVVDQFEELFTLCDDTIARQAFIDNLVVVALSPSTHHRIILTMRSDFESFVARVPSLQPLFEQARVTMTPLNAGELREAIELPAAFVGLKFESGVVEALLHDIVGEPAALPLLQFTLLKLWENRERNRVTMNSYRRLGGGRLALAHSADAFYEQLIPEERVTARRILLRMVRPSDGLEVTSSRIRREALYRANESAERVTRVLDKLVAAHLVRLTHGETPADDQVEVAHEALVRNWPTLVNWLDEERANITKRRLLESRAVEWVRLGQGNAGLLDEIETLEAEHWLRSPEAEAMGYNEAVPAFVQTSRTLIEETKREQNAAHERELAQARALAEAQQQQAEAEHLRAQAQEQRAQIEARAAHRLRRLTVLLVVALVVAVGATIYAISQARVATRQAHVAGAAFQASTLLDKALDLALVINVEAYRIDDSLAARGSLLTSLSYDPSIIRFLRGHTGAVKSVAFNPDSTLIASGGAEGTIVLWDVAVRKPLRSPLIGHTKSVNSVAFSPDGKVLASGSDDWTIILWDVATGQPIGRPLMGHTGPITQLAFSPDGTRLASGSTDKTALIWDIATRKIAVGPLQAVSSVPRGKGEVWSVAFHPSGQLLATGNSDNQITLWDVKTGKPIGPSLNHTRWVRSVAFSPDGHTLVAGGGLGLITVWDVDKQAKISDIPDERSNTLWSIVFSPDGRTLATGSIDGSVSLLDVAIAKTPSLGSSPLIRTYHSHTTSAYSVAFSNDGGLLVSGSSDTTVILRDLKGTQGLGQLVSHYGAKMPSVAFSPDGTQVLVGNTSPTQAVGLWTMATKQLTRTASQHTGGVLIAVYSPDGRFFASGDTDGHIALWDAHTLAFIKWLGLNDESDINGLAFSRNNQQLVSVNGEGKIIFWDINSGQQIGDAVESGNSLLSLALNPASTILATSDDQGNILLWDITACTPTFRNGPCAKKLGTLAGHTSIVWGLSFSPDGKLLVSGSSDQTVRLWNVATLQAKGSPVSSHDGVIRSVTFSPDGTTLASGSADGTITLWSVNELQQVGTLNNVGQGIQSAVFSPDGRYIASGDDGGRLVLWDISFEGLRRYTCSLTNRTLSREEWQRYFGSEPYQSTCPDVDITAAQPSDIEKAVGMLATIREQGMQEATAVLTASTPISRTQLADASLAQEFDRFAALRFIGEIRGIDMRSRQLENDIPTAEQALTKARALRADIDIDLMEEEQYITMLRKLSESRKLIVAGHIEDSIHAFDEARKLNPELDVNPFFEARICSFGSLQKQPKLVMSYCEEAAQRDPNIRFDRGIARAIAGQTADAIVDFQWYIQYSDDGGSHDIATQLRGYVNHLKQGENPFTDSELENLLKFANKRF